MKKVKLAIGLIAVIVAFFLTTKDSVKQPPEDRGAHLFRNMPKYLTNNIETPYPYTLTTPKTDPDTGWINLGSNRWQLQGYIVFPKKRIPWQAHMLDKGTNATIEIFQIGTNRVDFTEIRDTSDGFMRLKF